MKLGIVSAPYNTEVLPFSDRFSACGTRHVWSNCNRIVSRHPSLFETNYRGETQCKRLHGCRVLGSRSALDEIGRKQSAQRSTMTVEY